MRRVHAMRRVENLLKKFNPMTLGPNNACQSGNADNNRNLRQSDEALLARAELSSFPS